MKLNHQKCLALIGIFFVSMTLCLHSFPKIDLSPKYENWLKKEAIYIITPKEEEVFLDLEKDQNRDLFIEEFWRQRDPTPSTQRNEYKEEHYRRIEYANDRFGMGTSTEGWRTDRGKFYIKLGRPINVEKFMSAETRPIEIWYYQGNPKLGQASFFRLLFFQDNRGGDFILYDPIAHGPKRLVPFTSRTDPLYDKDNVMGSDPERAAAIRRMYEQHLDDRDMDAWLLLRYNVSIDVAQASFSSFVGSNGPEYRLQSSMLLGEIETYPQKRVEDDYAYEFLKHKTSVEVNYSVYYMGNQSIASVLQDPAGIFFINYLIQPEVLSMDFFQNKYIADVKTSVRITDSDKKTIYQGERNTPIELREEELKMLEKSSYHFCDSFPVIPGKYTFNLLLQNMVTKEFTSFEKEISVPETGSLEMSSPVLARKVNKNSPFTHQNRAFQVGSIQLYPTVDFSFSRKDKIFAFFQIHALDQELIDTGLLDYSFYQNGERIQRTRKKVSDYENTQTFLEEFSLINIAPGSYDLKITLLDKTGSELLSNTMPISVVSKSLPSSWVMAKSNPSAEEPYTSLVLGLQYLNQGNLTKAHDLLQEVYESKTDSMDYAVGYARVLWTMRAFNRLKEILLPFAQAEKKNFEIYFYLGRSSQKTGDLKGAIDYYQKALSQRGIIPDILNSLGECHLGLGENEQALKAWEKSLEINPKQERIINLVKNLKEKKSSP